MPLTFHDDAADHGVVTIVSRDDVHRYSRVHLLL